MAYYNDKSSWLSDDPTWGTEDVFEYKSSPVTITLLSLFLLGSIALVVFNSMSAYNQYHHLVYIKLGHRPGLWSNTHTRLNLLQVLGSFFNMLNQSYFLILEVGRGLPCSPLVTMGGFIYTVMVLCVSSVMEQRSTTLLKGRNRQRVRILMYILILIAVSTIAASNALRTWHLGLLKLGVCSARWHRKLNTIGKGCIAVLYAWFIFVFIKPLYQHSKAMRTLTSHQGNQTTEKLNDLVRSLFIKIVLCIFALVFTTLLGTLQLFGRYTTIEFSIQNAAMVYASTLAMKRFGRRRNMDGDSTSGTTSIMENNKETAVLSATLVGSRNGRKGSLQIHSNKPILRPSVPTPFAASPRTANYGVSILTSTAASPPQVHGHMIMKNSEISATQPYTPPQDEDITVEVISHNQVARKATDTITTVPVSIISEENENDEDKHIHELPGLGLRRVCSGVWVGEDNEATLINMATVGEQVHQGPSYSRTINHDDRIDFMPQRQLATDVDDSCECWIAEELDVDAHEICIHDDDYNENQP